MSPMWRNISTCHPRLCLMLQTPGHVIHLQRTLPVRTASVGWHAQTMPGIIFVGFSIALHMWMMMHCWERGSMIRDAIHDVEMRMAFLTTHLVHVCRLRDFRILQRVSPGHIHLQSHRESAKDFHLLRC